MQLIAHVKVIRAQSIFKNNFIGYLLRVTEHRFPLQWLIRHCPQRRNRIPVQCTLYSSHQTTQSLGMRTRMYFYYSGLISMTIIMLIREISKIYNYHRKYRHVKRNKFTSTAVSLKYCTPALVILTNVREYYGIYNFCGLTSGHIFCVQLNVLHVKVQRAEKLYYTLLIQNL